MNEKKMEGDWDQTKGDLKSAVGDVTGNEQLQAEGAFDRVKGGVKKAVGEVQDAVRGDDKV